MQSYGNKHTDIDLQILDIMYLNCLGFYVGLNLNNDRSIFI